MKREDRIIKLKNKIDEYINNGGNIYDKKVELPYYSYMINIIKEDSKRGTISSIESLYNECGYEYTGKRNEITLERVKEAITSYVEGGGSIYDKKENLPYYYLVTGFISKHKETGWTLKKIYEECGYEYKDKKQEVTIERLKGQIDEFVKSGGDVYDTSKRPPYHDLLCSFINKYKKKGIVYTFEEVMEMCGYERFEKKVK